ncbi:MAG: hypothetical protein AAFN38_21265 [Cyanobacteria bacterium J06560_5]
MARRNGANKTGTLVEVWRIGPTLLFILWQKASDGGCYLPLIANGAGERPLAIAPS